MTPQRALQLLRKILGGVRLLQRIKVMGGPSTPTQIAFFTPKTWTGNVGFIDFHNADLRAGISDISDTYQNDQVYFDVRKKTAYDGINLKHPNGVAQAFFHVEEDADVLVVAKVSSEDAKIRLAVDSKYGTDFRVQGNGVELSRLARVKRGVHRINLIQRRRPRRPFWFHSITVFQI